MKIHCIFLAILIFSIVEKLYCGEITIDTVDNYRDWNKKAIVIDNEIIELIILPEIGGRVIHYGFKNDQYMAINESTIGITYNPDEDNYGPWKNNWGYGGYKVWPAPQSKWNWPPPPHLAWGDYSFTINKYLPDSVLIYLESKEETALAPGLIFSRMFKIYNNSTLVQVEQTIKNNNTANQTWSIWDVTQTIVQHNNNKDYSNFNVYFPSSKNDVWHTSGPINSVTEMEPGLSKFQYDESQGKLFTYLEDGWVCFTDELDEQSYLKIFEIEDGTYPDDGANLEIYSGNNYIEIEVLSPLVDLSGSGGSYTYNEYWYASKLNGPVYSANKAGAIKEKINYDHKSKKLTGEFGVFNTGYLNYSFYNDAMEEVFQSNPIQVSASERITLDKMHDFVIEPSSCKLNAYTPQGELIQTLSEWKAINVSSFQRASQSHINIYPTILRSTDIIYINGLSGITSSAIINILEIEGKVIFTEEINSNTKNYSIQLPSPSSGIYFINLIYNNNSLLYKIIIY